MRTLTVLLIALLCGAGSLTAQTPALPSPGDVAATMALMKQAMNPARVAIAASRELALSASQTAALDSLAVPFDAVVEQTMMAGSGAGAAEGAMADPNAPIDEEAIRTAYREQAERQSNLLISMLKLERAVNQLLTPEQREKWTEVRMNGVMSIMGAMMGADR